MLRIASGIVIACLLEGMCSCSRVGRLLDPEGPVNTSVPEVPPEFRGGRGGGNQVTRVSVDEPTEVTPENVEKVRSREADLVWTDPDNPESGLQGMEEVMAQSANRGPWMISYSEARRASVREGRPMLVWFTNSYPGKSPLCKALSAEVFTPVEFETWAEAEVVRLRIDFNVQGESGGPDDSAMDDKVRKLDYLESLKKRYKVLGLPAVLVLAPDGTVIGSYRGFKKSYGDFYFKRLKNDVEAGRAHHEEWIQTMERRGYRMWTDQKGRTVLAKLQQYKDGDLILVEPDGKKLKAREGNLSSPDQLWLAGEKAKRGR